MGTGWRGSQRRGSRASGNGLFRRRGRNPDCPRSYLRRRLNSRLVTVEDRDFRRYFRSHSQRSHRHSRGRERTLRPGSGTGNPCRQSTAQTARDRAVRTPLPDGRTRMRRPSRARAVAAGIGRGRSYSIRTIEKVCAGTSLTGFAVLHNRRGRVCRDQRLGTDGRTSSRASSSSW